MNSHTWSERTPQDAIVGRVASLHIHPSERSAPMTRAVSIEVVEGKGIVGNLRYFDRRSQRTGQPSKRQISLIEREQLAEHAAALGLEKIAPGAVRANIETEGVELISLIGQEIEVGSAVLLITEARTPCAKMDAICPGLRALMSLNRQGVLAKVIRSGRIQAGDPIRTAGVTHA